MKSIVTGGCGFIGSHIVDELIKEKHEVVVIDDESAECNDKFYYNEKASYNKVSICNYESIQPLFEGVDYVFHLAAESRIQPALERPMDACLVNFVGTCNVLEAARKHHSKKLIYSSTSSAYGNNTRPLKEDMPRDCLNPYSVSKVAAEDLVRMYYTLWGLPTVILRYFNVYGERSPTKGLYSPVIGVFKKQKNQNIPLTIVGDGSQKRDFVNVKDVVQANMKAAKGESRNILGEVFNVGSGENISILEIAKTISSHYSFVPKREGEAETTIADISKARDLLSYEPEVRIRKYLS